MSVRVVLWRSNYFSKAFSVPDEVPLVTATDIFFATVRADDHQSAFQAKVEPHGFEAHRPSLEEGG